MNLAVQDSFLLLTGRIKLFGMNTHVDDDQGAFLTPILAVLALFKVLESTISALRARMA